MQKTVWKNQTLEEYLHTIEKLARNNTGRRPLYNREIGRVKTGSHRPVISY